MKLRRGSSRNAEARARPIVLFAIGAFWPGNDSSGPNQSFRALAESLDASFDFRLLARDRPFDASVALAASGEWTELGYCKAFYSQVGRLGPRGVRLLLHTLQPDVIWLNGFFDREFTLPMLIQRRLGLLGNIPAILSPRGEFGDGAMSLKSGAKKAYLKAARAANLLHDVTLHATSAEELHDIRLGVPWHDRFAIAPNARALINPPPRMLENEVELTLVFLGRISRVKNLDYAIDVLLQVRTKICFDICGPIQDAAFWQECQERIARLPKNVRVVYSGVIANAAVAAKLGQADILFLPTRGENFGHAIFEALSCGTPALISDKTPWRELERDMAGWDLPLDSPVRFAVAIDSFGGMDEEGRTKWRLGARRRAECSVKTSAAIESSHLMLEEVTEIHRRDLLKRTVAQ